MQFQVQITGLADLITRLQQAPSIVAPILQRALSASQAILAKYTTKQTVPWRTGFLAQTFQAQLTTGMLRWFPTASYASFVEFGTKPHIIEPKNARALFWPGAEHPVRIVHHPGTAENPFMERIIAAAQPEIDMTFTNALEQIVQQIGGAQ